VALRDKPTILHRYLLVFPESSLRFGDDDAEIDSVGKRRVPADPIVRENDVVSSQTIGERSYKYGVGVGVDAAVLQHDIGSPNVARMRRTGNCLSIHLADAILCNSHAVSRGGQHFNHRRTQDFTMEGVHVMGAGKVGLEDESPRS